MTSNILREMVQNISFSLSLITLPSIATLVVSLSWRWLTCSFKISSFGACVRTSLASKVSYLSYCDWSSNFIAIHFPSVLLSDSNARCRLTFSFWSACFSSWGSSFSSSDYAASFFSSSSEASLINTKNLRKKCLIFRRNCLRSVLCRHIYFSIFFYL